MTEASRWMRDLKRRDKIRIKITSLLEGVKLEDMRHILGGLRLQAEDLWGKGYNTFHDDERAL